MTINAEKLPTDSLAKLIKLAIKDARGLSHDIYTPHSDYWHNAQEGFKCEICLAGAVIAGSLKVPASDKCHGLGRFDRKTGNALDALDSARLGEWGLAYGALGQARREVDAQGYGLPIPDPRHFDGWDAFNLHLDSLEGIVPLLEEFEMSIPA